MITRNNRKGYNDRERDRRGYHDREYGDYYDQEEYLSGRYKQQFNDHYDEGGGRSDQRQPSYQRNNGTNSYYQHQDRYRNDYGSRGRGTSSMGGHGLHAGYDFEQANTAGREVRNNSRSLADQQITARRVRRRPWRFGGARLQKR